MSAACRRPNPALDMLLDRVSLVCRRVCRHFCRERAEHELDRFARTVAADGGAEVNDVFAGMLFDLDDRELLAVSLGAVEESMNRDGADHVFDIDLDGLGVGKLKALSYACCCDLNEFAHGILTGEEAVSKAGPWMFLSAYTAYVRKNRKGGYDVLRLKQHEYLWSVCYASLSKEDCAGEFEDGPGLHLYWQGILEKALENNLFADKYGYVFDGEVWAMKKMMELTANPYNAHGKDMG